MLIPLNGLRYNTPMGPVPVPPVPIRRTVDILLSRHPATILLPRHARSVYVSAIPTTLLLPRHVATLYLSRHDTALSLSRATINLEV